jgi:DNA recombination-dependent growth factor C
MNSNEEVKPLLTSDTTEVSLLPAEVIERIRAKEMVQVAAREERRQKKSEAEKLADAASVKNCAKSRRPPDSGGAT